MNQSEVSASIWKATMLNSDSIIIGWVAYTIQTGSQATIGPAHAFLFIKNSKNFSFPSLEDK